MSAREKNLEHTNKKDVSSSCCTYSNVLVYLIQSWKIQLTERLVEGGNDHNVLCKEK